jgi:DNA invertase Pin-like site-specific DNA recombinase
MKNIVYSYYSRDLSVKAKTAKRAKMKRGEHRGGQAPYGYDTDPEKPGGLIVDPVAARVVREIYDAFLSGNQMYEIVDILNQRGEDPPSKYYGKKHPEFRG